MSDAKRPCSKHGDRMVIRCVECHTYDRPDLSVERTTGTEK